MQQHERNDILLYQAEDGKTHLEVQLDHETVWLTQSQLAALFDVQIPTISKHVRNILATGELDASATVSKMERVHIEGDRRSPRCGVGKTVRGKSSLTCVSKLVQYS